MIRGGGSLGFTPINCASSANSSDKGEEISHQTNCFESDWELPTPLFENNKLRTKPHQGDDEVTHGRNSKIQDTEDETMEDADIGDVDLSDLLELEGQQPDDFLPDCSTDTLDLPLPPLASQAPPSRPPTPAPKLAFAAPAIESPRSPPHDSDIIIDDAEFPIASKNQTQDRDKQASQVPALYYKQDFANMLTTYWYPEHGVKRTYAWPSRSERTMGGDPTAHRLKKSRKKSGNQMQASILRWCVYLIEYDQDTSDSSSSDADDVVDDDSSDW